MLDEPFLHSDRHCQITVLRTEEAEDLEFRSPIGLIRTSRIPRIQIPLLFSQQQFEGFEAIEFESNSKGFPN